MDIMKDIPDKYFELAIVDPPYGIGINKMNFVKSGAIKVGGAYRNDYKDTKWNDESPNEDYFAEVLRVSQNQIIWGGNYFTDKLKPVKSWVIWDKRVEEKYNNDFADGEMAWTSFECPMKIFRFLYSGMLQSNMKNKEVRFHPTQKPVALYKWLLKNYAKQGNKILDTHGGSCSSVVACIDYGFEYLAIEKDKDYYEASLKRIDKELQKIKMF